MFCFRRSICIKSPRKNPKKIAQNYLKCPKRFSNNFSVSFQSQVLQGMYYTYFVSVITTIEKLFQIQSKTTGIIMSATEIGQISSSLLLTYYGGQGHRPKWIAWGMILFAVSSFTCSMPHFIFGEQLLHQNKMMESHVPGSNITTPSYLCKFPELHENGTFGPNGYVKINIKKKKSIQKDNKVLWSDKAHLISRKVVGHAGPRIRTPFFSRLNFFI